MNRKLKKLSAFVAFLLMALLSSCSNAPKYADCIPDDSSVLVTFDVKQMAEQGNFENGTLKTKIQKLVDDESMSAEAKQKLKDVIDDPAQLGVDLRVPLLLAANVDAKSENLTMFAQLHSASKLKDFISAMAKDDESLKLQEKGELSYVALGDLVMAFNSDVLCMHKNESAEQAIADIEAMLAGDKSKTIKDSKSLDKLFSANGIVQMLVRGSLFNSLQKLSPYPTPTIAGLDYKDVDMLLTLESKKGAAVITSEYITESDKWKDYIKKSDELLQPIDDDMLKFASKNGFAMIMNFNGAKILDYLNANGLLKDMNSEQKNMLQAMKAVNGDVVLSFDAFDIRNSNISFGMFAKTTDDSLVKLLEPIFGRQATVGYSDNLSYCVMRGGKQPLQAAENAVEKGDIKGKLYCRFNFDMLKPIVGELYGGEAMGAKTVLDTFSTAELSYLGDGKIELAFYMHDSSKSPLEIFSDQIVSYMN